MSSFIREFLSTFLNEAKHAFAFSSSLEIVEDNGVTLLLKSGSRHIYISKQLRTVTSGGRALAQFDAIETIDLTHHISGDDNPESWSVSLNLKGWLSSVALGKTRNDVDASIVAARISKFTGKKVRSL